MSTPVAIERLARALTNGDPDRLSPICYLEVVARSEREGSAPRSVPKVVMVPAWKLHEAEARIALSRDQTSSTP
jgi:hypothetical protein